MNMKNIRNYLLNHNQSIIIIYYIVFQLNCVQSVKNQDATYFVGVSVKDHTMPIVLNCLPWMKTQLTSNICVRIVPNLEEIVLFVKNLVPSILIRINVESLNYRIRSSSTINLMIPNRRYSFYIVH